MFPVHSYTNPVEKTLKKPLDCVDSNEHTVLLLKKLNTTSVLSSLKVTQVRGQDVNSLRCIWRPLVSWPTAFDSIY